MLWLPTLCLLSLLFGAIVEAVKKNEEDAGTRTAEHCGQFLRKLSKNLFDVTKIQQKISSNLTMTKSSWKAKKKERKEETVRDYCP